MYCLNLLRIALELAQHNHVYEDIATKFFEHFLAIAAAINGVGDAGCPRISLCGMKRINFTTITSTCTMGKMPMKVRSMSG